MKRALILGFGISGKAAARRLTQEGYSCTAVDRIFSDGVGSDENLTALDGIDLLVVSPGIPPAHPLIEAAKVRGIIQTSEIEIALERLQIPVIAITGTNGKTTVTELVAHILRTVGLKAEALGNIGVPLCDRLEAPLDVVVLEVSSYQLDSLSKPAFSSGVLLNITPDHLDRYRLMDDYARSKVRLQNLLHASVPFIVEGRSHMLYQHFFTRPVLRYGYEPFHECFTDFCSVYLHNQPIASVPAALRRGRSHDLENWMAACLLTAPLGATAEVLATAYESFVKPRHRIEFVAEHRGVQFFDDSKGTNLDAVIRAVERMEGATWLIAGGVDKGASYLPWKEAFGGKVRAIFAIGQAASLIHRDLSAHLPVHFCVDLQEAVSRAYQSANRGDNILLSPGCASFDMFRDYVHRGEQFQKIVRALS